MGSKRLHQDDSETCEVIPIRGKRAKRVVTEDPSGPSTGVTAGGATPAKSPSATTGLIPSSTWCSPSRIRNYMLGDPLLDWLQLHGNGVSERAGRPDPGDNSFVEFLMSKGREFEERVVDLIMQRFPGEVLRIANTARDILDRAKYRETVDAINRGHPIIYQGVLHDEAKRRFGSPDFIIRSDYLARLVPGTTLYPTKQCKKRFEKYLSPVYYIVDVKYTTLPLRADATRLLNSGSIPFYKAQLCMYNDMLRNIQGWSTPYAYLLGRGYTYTRCGVTYSELNCFAKLGLIDYEGVDSDTPERVERAVDWIERLRQHGASWTAYPIPSTPELFPNMANTKDYPWGPVKEWLAKQLREITMLWGCGLRHRITAHSQGIFHWDDSRLSAEVMGFKGPVQSRIIQTMIEFNRDDKTNVMRPAVIRDNRANWKQTPELEFYVDFETINNIFDDFTALPRSTGTAMIFMIGVGWVLNGQWSYRCFCAETLTHAAERILIGEFLHHMAEVTDTSGVTTRPNVYHWSFAETCHFEKALERHPDVELASDFQFVDLLSLWKDETILVKGVFDFSLKSVERGMADAGLIPKMYTGGVAGGDAAMIQSWRAYRTSKSTGRPVQSLMQFRPVITYNEVDCRVIWEIIKCVRSRCCSAAAVTHCVVENA